MRVPSGPLLVSRTGAVGQPGLTELRAKIAGVLNQPATKLVRLLGTSGQQLAQVLGARKEQLEKQAS